MQNSNYAIFKIEGVKKRTNYDNFFSFYENAICEVKDDQFVEKIEVMADVGKVIFYLHNSLKIEGKMDEIIIDYLYKYLGSMMISLLKNSLRYSRVPLSPVICLEVIHFIGNDNDNTVKLRDSISMRDTFCINYKFEDGDIILKQWIQDVDVADYVNKNDKYDILFLLLQGKNIVQKYMAMYAYLMSLVREIYSQTREGQKQVVRYVTDNCSRVGITLISSPSNRPGANAMEVEDQFTALRNKIGHPDTTDSYVSVSNKEVNELASIICCAIEDLPS